MDRRLLTVLSLSLLFALVVSGIFYQVLVSSRHAKAGTVAKRTDIKDLVVAAHSLPAGSNVKSADLRIVQVPADQFPKDSFSRIEEVVERPVVSLILQDEPVHEGRLAPRGAGSGLAPIIPAGMRAVPVRVNEVVGVAGFAVPGIRVDVLVTGRVPGGDLTVTKTVLQNILVLSAGQKLEADGRGQPIQAQVVTLLVTPEQAEVLTLAGSEGKIQLVLRNGTDQKIEATPGRELAELYGGRSKPAPRAAAARAVAPPKPPPAPAAAAPQTQEVVVIRGNQRSVETVAIQSGAGEVNP